MNNAAPILAEAATWPDVALAAVLILGLVASIWFVVRLMERL